MAKILLFLFSICYLLFAIFAIPTIAATPTPTRESKDSKEVINQQITDLKTRIASHVAELNLVEKRGIIGTVTDVSDTQITIIDLKNNTRFIDMDELTKFSNPAQKEFGISDITKGDTIGALGLYNKESRRILARFVSTIDLPVIVYGVIDSLDATKFRVKVQTEDNKEMFLDVEKTTKTSSYSKDEGLLRSGFSKIKGNERVIATGQANKEEENLITATRIILLPEILTTLR